VRIGVGGSASTLNAIVDEARAAEAMGAATYSLSNVFAHDAIGALAVVATRTDRIELLTAVIPAFPRHPMALAQQALTAQVVAGGRFTLGVGASQQPLIERVLGLSYEKPARRMREYLQVLLPLLQGQPTRFEGEFYRVRGGLTVNDARPVPCLIAALGPHMLRLAGELSGGTVLWLTGAKAVARHIAPRIRRAAANAGRPGPRIVCGLPIVLTREVDAARARANELWAGYGRLPSYRAMLDAQGVATPGDVVLAGDESALDAALAELEEAGVTTFLGTPFAVGDGAVERTHEYLAAKARESRRHE
jgi:F420-dependent oxidoreductase-like protein